MIKSLTRNACKMAINVGSSSIKTSLFSEAGRADININYIGLAQQTVKIRYSGFPGLEDLTYHVNLKNDLKQVAATIINTARGVLTTLGWQHPTLIGHRVKFAGYGNAVEKFTQTAEAVVQFNDYLSSRHNALCLEVLAQCKQSFPAAEQLMVRDQAVEDLCLHREETIPFSHALIRRYGLFAHGYHGLAVRACLKQVEKYIETKPFTGIICQLGSGVSFSAIDSGKTVYNTMQYAACDGPTMHNRSGTQPVGLTLRLLKYGLNPSLLPHLYNRLSGIYGLAGLPADSSITVEDILCSPGYSEAKTSYLKANSTELFRTLLELPDARHFIFSGGLATKHRWLGVALLHQAKMLSNTAMKTLTQALDEQNVHTAEAEGVTVHIINIDEQVAILEQCDAATDYNNNMNLSSARCEVPGTAIGIVKEGEAGWGKGHICLCLTDSPFSFDQDNLPEAFIFQGKQRSDFFFRSFYARSHAIPSIFIATSELDKKQITGKKIYLDTPTKTAVVL